MTNSTEPNTIESTDATRIRKLKSALIMSLVLIMFLAGLLFFNMQKIKTFSTISEGTYFTDQECQTKYGLGSLIPLGDVGPVVTNATNNTSVSGFFR